MPEPVAPSETVYYPHPRRQWNRVPTIAACALEGDPRVPMLLAAVTFWNEQFEAIGTPFRLGPLDQVSATVPADYLRARSAAVLRTPGATVPRVPEILAQLSGDIVVAMSDASFVSFAALLPGDRILVGIRGLDTGPFRLPNVARNVIAHELGHAIGLGHHNDPTKLMCGRPAPCRPDAFQSDVDRFFPLTDVERAKLLELYPSDWQPLAAHDSSSIAVSGQE